MIRFVLALTAILAGAYVYLAWRIAPGASARLALAVPFLLVWVVPVFYWTAERNGGGWMDDLLHFASYACMGWLNFALLLSAARDVLLLASWSAAPLAGVHAALRESGAGWVVAGSFAAFAMGMLAAFRGPRLCHVDIPIEGLDPALDGVRIAHISDLHVGPTIGVRYVRRVVRMANALRADLVALTGDLVDGSVARLAPHVAPLGDLRPAGRVFFVPGNHEYYSGAAQWLDHFRGFGWRVLLNEHAEIAIGGARMIVGGVTDPAAAARDRTQVPRPDLAAAPLAGPAFRLLLAHNPSLAPRARAAGFDLQLSGHTHAGQFFPWTLAVHMVHAPHVAGLSRAGRMWVYVSAGTGTWGPPVRFGSEPELALVRLVRVPPAA